MIKRERKEKMKTYIVRLKWPDLCDWIWLNNITGISAFSAGNNFCITHSSLTLKMSPINIMDWINQVKQTWGLKCVFFFFCLCIFDGNIGTAFHNTRIVRIPQIGQWYSIIHSPGGPRRDHGLLCSQKPLRRRDLDAGPGLSWTRHHKHNTL